MDQVGLYTCHGMGGNQVRRSFNTPHSRYWTGTRLQLRLIREVFSNANDINLFFNDIPFCMSLFCKLVPVQYREYEDDPLRAKRPAGTSRLTARSRHWEKRSLLRSRY